MLLKGALATSGRRVQPDELLVSPKGIQPVEEGLRHVAGLPAPLCTSSPPGWVYGVQPDADVGTITTTTGEVSDG